VISKRILINIAQYLFFFLLGVGLLYLAFRSIDFRVLFKRILETRLDLLIISLLFGLLGMIGRSFRWKLMIEPLGYKPSFINTYHALIIGYTANYAFPRIGEITRCGVLNQTDRIPADQLIGTVIAERAWDVIMLVVLTFTVVLCKLSTFGQFFSQKIIYPLGLKFHWVTNVSIFIWGAIIVFILAVLSIIIVYRSAIKRFILKGKIGQFFYGIYNGIKSVLKMKKWFLFILTTLFIWLVYILMTFFALKALPPTNTLNFIDAFFIMIVGSYGFVMPVQGGIGAYHGIVALGLSLYSISWNDAMAYALLSHESQAVSIILLGLISMLILGVNKRRLKPADTIEK
jgi:uncharacterized protein (TIRG00374 family)